MNRYTIRDVIMVLNIIADETIAAKAKLTEIDSKLGDGDMGISMEKGALAIKKELTGLSENEKDISRLFMTCASSFNRAAPSTMGTLLSAGLLALAKKCIGKTELTAVDIVFFPEVLAETIAFRGKASVGDKTVLDALYPYAQVLQSVYSETQDLQQALNKAAQAAAQGVESTKGIVAKTGRAKWLAERNMDYPDGGAVLCCKIGMCFANNTEK